MLLGSISSPKPPAEIDGEALSVDAEPGPLR